MKFIESYEKIILAAGKERKRIEVAKEEHERNKFFEFLVLLKILIFDMAGMLVRFFCLLFEMPDTIKKSGKG